MGIYRRVPSFDEIVELVEENHPELGGALRSAHKLGFFDDWGSSGFELLFGSNAGDRLALESIISILCESGVIAVVDTLFLDYEDCQKLILPSAMWYWLARHGGSSNIKAPSTLVRAFLYFFCTRLDCSYSEASKIIKKFGFSNSELNLFMPGLSWFCNEIGYCGHFATWNWFDRNTGGHGITSLDRIASDPGRCTVAKKVCVVGHAGMVAVVCDGPGAFIDDAVISMLENLCTDERFSINIDIPGYGPHGLDPIERAMPASNLKTGEIKKVWIIDSGATTHICGDRDAFIYFHTLREGEKFVMVGDSRRVPVSGKGEVILRLDSGKLLLLSEVLYVPGFDLNLLSVSSLGKDGIKTFFDCDKVVFLKNGEFIGNGDAESGLFMLRVAETVGGRASTSSVSGGPPPTTTVHGRIGISDMTGSASTCPTDPIIA